MLKRHTPALLALVVGCGAQSGVIGESELEVLPTKADSSDEVTADDASERDDTTSATGDANESDGIAAAPNDGSETVGTGESASGGEPVGAGEAADEVGNGDGIAIAPAPTPGPLASSPPLSGVGTQDPLPASAGPQAEAASEAGPGESAEEYVPCSDATPIPLPPEVIAERLSNLLFDTGATPELLEMAIDGQLQTYADVECAALDLIEQPEAAQGLLAFLETWLGFESWPYSPNAKLDVEVWAEMQVQAQSFLVDFAESGDTTLAHLLTEPEAQMFPALAEHLALKDVGELPGRVLVPEQRGVLTLGLVTASLNRIGRRGRWVLETMQCLLVPPKPADLVPETFADVENFQESYTTAVSNAICVGCHSVFDSYGFALENFDVVGRPQTEEAGQPLVVSGEVIYQDTLGNSEPIAFDGPDEFMAALSDNALVQSCLARTAIHHTTGVEIDSAVESEANKVQALFSASGDDLAQLLVAVTQVDSFWQ